MASFIFGGDTGNTPQSIERQRAIAAALAQANASAPTNVGEGLTAIGRALAYRSLLGQAADAEKTGQAQAMNEFQGLFADGAQPTMADLARVASDPFISANPGESAILQAMTQRSLNQSDPAYRLDLQYKQAQLDALNHKSDAPIVVNGQLVDPSTYKVVGDFRDPQKPIEASPNATLLDPITRQPVYTAPAAPTNNEQEYNFYANQEKQGGRTPLSFGDWLMQTKKAGASNINLNTGENSGAFAKAADEAAAKRMNEYVAAGNNAQQFTGDLNALAEIGKNINTGKGAEITKALGPYAQALGIDIQGLGETQAYQSIIDRLAPNMRAPGSGSSSDTDVRMFLNSLPQLGNTPEGNQIIIDTLQAIQKAKMAAADLANQALSGQITWQEADRKIRALGDPYTAFNEYRKRAAALDKAKEQVNPADPNAVPQGVDPALWQYMSPEERALWQKH